MTVLHGIALGIVQGLTEFLPVSSSGHLVLVQNIMGLDGNMLFFDTMLHVGTLVAVLAVFWKDVSRILHHPVQKLTGLLIIATIPAVLATLLFNDFFERAFSGEFLGIGFLLTAAVLTASELISVRMEKHKKNMGYPTALIIGAAQAVAIVPGLSRSGSTLAGGLFCGIERNTAARFAFLMSIPVILGSVVYQGFSLVKDGAGELYILPTIVGMLFAMISGFFAIRFMLNVIKKYKMFGFAIYTALLGIVVLLDQFVWNNVFPPMA